MERRGGIGRKTKKVRLNDHIEDGLAAELEAECSELQEEELLLKFMWEETEAEAEGRKKDQKDQKFQKR